MAPVRVEAWGLVVPIPMFLSFKFFAAVGAKAVSIFAHGRVGLTVAFAGKGLIDLFATARTKSDRGIGAAMIHIPAAFLATHILTVDLSSTTEMTEPSAIWP